MEVGYSPQSSWLLLWNVSSATIIERSVYLGALDCSLRDAIEQEATIMKWTDFALCMAACDMKRQKAHFLRPLSTLDRYFLFLSAALVIDVRTERLHEFGINYSWKASPAKSQIAADEHAAKQI